MATRAKTPPLEAAVKRAVTAAGRRAPAVRRSWEGELALRLAREIEKTDHPLAAKASAARRLTETMALIEQAAGAAPEADRLDELAARRGRRAAAS